jgi:hypothetical protein
MEGARIRPHPRWREHDSPSREHHVTPHVTSGTQIPLTMPSAQRLSAWQMPPVGYLPGRISPSQPIPSGASL